MKINPRNTAAIALIAVCLLLSTAAAAISAEDAGVKWRSYDEGLKLAKAKKKKIFLNFYADWCHYCSVMKAETFSQPHISNYLNEHYVPVRVNSDRRPHLAKEYQVRGLPLSIFLDENAKNIGSQPGFIAPEQFLPLLKYVYTDSYKKMNFRAFLDQSAN
ncbi:MAG: hypothetical protein CSB33_01155 [Desulfobacterales bacterium]|nr:MAG: hypothetical protein CSB33_01155 [Desulfobacterales bacterium]